MSRPDESQRPPHLELRVENSKLKGTEDDEDDEDGDVDEEVYHLKDVGGHDHNCQENLDAGAEGALQLIWVIFFGGEVGKL